MYAVVETGGKQYRVQPGSIIEFEKLPGDVGGTVELTTVRLIERNGELSVGRPWIDQARVTGEILAQDRTRSITVFKKKRRKNYRRTKGHRQAFTRVRITDITTA
jgi:large subunit ribosomal protein L21